MKKTSMTLASVLLMAACMIPSMTASAAAPAGAPANAAGGAAGGRGGAGAGGAARGGGGAGRGGRGGGFAAIPPGPPAPIPPEVAQPDADVIAKINAEVKRLVDSDTSPEKSLVQKYESMLMLPPPRLNVAATYTQTQQRMGPRHEGFVEQAKKGDIDVLLEGDSITDLWLSSHKANYEKYFGTLKTANFAISGDTTQGVLWGLKNGEGQGFQPKAIMIMIGTNNTSTNTGPEIAEGVGAVVLENRKDFPDAKILLLAIFPRGTGPTDASRLKNIEANKLLSKLDDGKHVFFMDIGPKFLDANGVLLPGTFNTDNLHPADPGYDIWGPAVLPTLTSWLK